MPEMRGVLNRHPWILAVFILLALVTFIIPFGHANMPPCRRVSPTPWVARRRGTSSASSPVPWRTTSTSCVPSMPT